MNPIFTQNFTILRKYKYFIHLNLMKRSKELKEFRIGNMLRNLDQ